MLVFFRIGKKRGNQETENGRERKRIDNEQVQVSYKGKGSDKDDAADKQK